MTCKCGSIFCWLCGKTIGGYSHFSYIGCELFQGTQQDVENPVRQIPRVRILRLANLIEAVIKLCLNINIQYSIQ